MTMYFKWVKISIHALREEGDQREAEWEERYGTFLSTPSARRATNNYVKNFHHRRYFYPRPPRGGRLNANIASGFAGVFLSTPSARRATEGVERPWRNLTISIHALREEGDPALRRRGPDAGISIHALREEGDVKQEPLPARKRKNFYPRPPRGGRLVNSAVLCYTMAFLSTPSARRATYADMAAAFLHDISIHALREEGDCAEAGTTPNAVLFLSTPSARRATFQGYQAGNCIERFLSTPSARRATWLMTMYFKWVKISIHALREEGDFLANEELLCGQVFLSTPSARRATLRMPQKMP